MTRSHTPPTSWEAATDPRAPLGLRRVSRQAPAPAATRPHPPVTHRRDRGVVWAVRGLAIASGAGLCSLSSDQPLDTIIIGGVGLLSVLGISLATLDWLAGGHPRRRVEAGLKAAGQALYILFAVAVMPIAWPLSLWLQRREAARGRRGGREAEQGGGTRP